MGRLATLFVRWSDQVRGCSEKKALFVGKTHQLAGAIDTFDDILQNNTNQKDYKNILRCLLFGLSSGILGR